MKINNLKQLINSDEIAALMLISFLVGGVVGITIMYDLERRRNLGNFSKSDLQILSSGLKKCSEAVNLFDQGDKNE